MPKELFEIGSFQPLIHVQPCKVHCFNSLNEKSGLTVFKMIR